MKISYNWLKQYLQFNSSPAELSELLTDCGLEVESLEKFESIKGGLENVVIGEVITKEKHPDADRLSVTTVNTGDAELLHIVCGAPNVAAGQKVLVAKVGAKLYPYNSNDCIEIKKSKIRGAVSEGMICAEDELGTSPSHDGILVLNNDAVVGTPASQYFKIETDWVFEIGLTPNRVDAASHIGVARDIAAVLNLKNNSALTLQLPDITSFKPDSNNDIIPVEIENPEACKRYSSVIISNITVAESPDWLKNKLQAVGMRAINNVVDITNYVLMEYGHPLHAFDADKIEGKKVIVKKLPEGTAFKTLDEAERKLNANDLMICDSRGGMCIAGVFGGINSGVSEKTKTVFLESAYFDATHIRKTAKHHGLKTDASFRFERGADPEITVVALKRAAMLIKEICKGTISSEVNDIYPQKIKPHAISLNYNYCDNLTGKIIDRKIIQSLLNDLGFTIKGSTDTEIQLLVPSYKVDVTREADVVEEILRIYGYNNIEIPNSVKSSLSYSPKPDKEKTVNVISDFLSNKGFNEIVCNSLVKGELHTAANDTVTLLNPLSSDLDTLRKNLLFGALDSVAYNINRKCQDLKFFEFGKTYAQHKNESTVFYTEENKFAITLSGKAEPAAWNKEGITADIYTIKGIAEAVLNRLGIQKYKVASVENELLISALQYTLNGKELFFAGQVNNQLLKKWGIKQSVLYAEFNLDSLLKATSSVSVVYSEVPKFPEVKRDLALVVEKNVQYDQLKNIAFETEKKILKRINLFDVYEGDKVEQGKKSYALSFILQDENATLTDQQIDKVMEKLMRSFADKAGAVVRAN